MANKPNPMTELSKTKPKSNQMDRDFYFDGIDGTRIEHKSTKWQGNQSGLTQKQSFRQLRTGNASDSSYDRMSSIGPSATFDAKRETVATAKQSKNPVEEGRARREYPADIDRITAGNRQDRSPWNFSK